jgi:hypothetical protein
MSTVSAPTNPEGSPAGIWVATPRQPKQERCRQNLAHSKPKRTFFWIMESNGPVCQDCVNLRETKRAIAEGQLSGNTGNGAMPGKSGKATRSTKAPAIMGAVLAKRAVGESKAKIARELRISHNTVDAIIKQTDFDAKIAEGRAQAVELIPEALSGAQKAFAKGDGATSCRFLEGLRVLGEDRKPKALAMYADVALMNTINMLYNPSPKIDPEPINVTQPAETPE